MGDPKRTKSGVMSWKRLTVSNKNAIKAIAILSSQIHKIWSDLAHNIHTQLWCSCCPNNVHLLYLLSGSCQMVYFSSFFLFVLFFIFFCSVRFSYLFYLIWIDKNGNIQKQINWFYIYLYQFSFLAWILNTCAEFCK